jgi:hypothetical protein
LGVGSCFIYTAFVAKFLSFVFNYFILFFDCHYAYNVQCAFSSGMSAGRVLFWFNSCVRSNHKGWFLCCGFNCILCLHCIAAYAQDERLTLHDISCPAFFIDSSAFNGLWSYLLGVLCPRGL